MQTRLPPVVNETALSHARIFAEKFPDTKTLPGSNQGQLIVTVDLDQTLLQLTSARHSAYIRYPGGLCYRNERGEIIYFPDLDKRSLLLFDLELELKYSSKKETHRYLTEKDFKKILFLTRGLRNWLPKRVAPHNSEWQKKNGVDLLWVNTSPEEDKFDSDNLPFSNAAYLRYRKNGKDQLWYIKKNQNGTPERRLLPVKGEALKRFDVKMGTAFKFHQHLNDKAIKKIGELTGHTHRTLWQQFLYHFGYFLSALRAFACGLIAANAFLMLNILTGGGAIVIAILLFLTGTAVNWWLLKPSVSPVLIDLFGREKFLVDENGEDLSFGLKMAISIATLVSGAVGITLAAITYGSTLHLTVGLAFLAPLAPALPYLAFILLAVTLVTMTALMLKGIADLIKQENVIGKGIEFLKDLVDTSPKLPRDQGKSPRRIVVERIITVALTLILIPLTILGLYMTMNACTPDVKAFLLQKIPQLSAVAAHIITTSVSLVLAFIGRIPFGIKITMQTIAAAVPAIVGVFYSNNPEPVAQNNPPQTIRDRAWRVFEFINVGINGIGNGFISMMGAIGSTFHWLAFIGGTENSIFAGVSSILKRKPEPVEIAVLPRSQDDLHIHSSTSDMLRAYETLNPQPLKEFRPNARAEMKSEASVIGQNSALLCPYMRESKSESKEEPLLKKKTSPRYVMDDSLITSPRLNERKEEDDSLVTSPHPIARR